MNTLAGAGGAGGIPRDVGVHTRFVQMIYGGTLIEPKEGEEIFKRYVTARKNGTIVEFDTLTGDNLFEHVK